MAGLAPVELTVDCSACGLEAGVVEVYDALVAACRFGLPASTRCKLCAVATKGVLDRPTVKPLLEIPANRCPVCLCELTASALDARACPSCATRALVEQMSPPSAFTAVADLERALDAWADREQFASREALVRATFVEPDIAKLFERLRRKEPLEILADPFANMGIRTTGGSARQKGTTSPSNAKSTAPETPQAKATAELGSPRHIAPSVAEPPTAQAPAPARAAAETIPQTSLVEDPALAATEPLAPPLSRADRPPPSAPPRAIVYPLVSVIVADGEIHPEELALVDRFLQSEGLAPLAPHELCVHHPSEVAHFVPKERREDVVRLMCESAAVDGMPDESERRVIRAYATAWDVDDEKLEFWMWGYETMNTSLARQLFLKLRRFVLSARWGEADGRG